MGARGTHEDIEEIHQIHQIHEMHEMYVVRGLPSSRRDRRLEGRNPR